MPRLSIIFCLSTLLTAGSLLSSQDAAPDATPLLKACSHKNHAPCIDKLPSITHRVEPEYSVEAHNARIEGTVTLLARIGTDGLAHDIRVAQHLGYGLDELAVEALKKWTFNPAKSAGKPVPAEIAIEIPFSYH